LVESDQNCPIRRRRNLQGPVLQAVRLLIYGGGGILLNIMILSFRIARRKKEKAADRFAYKCSYCTSKGEGFPAQMKINSQGIRTVS